MLANLKFSHLNLLWSHVAQLVKRLNSNRLSIVLINSLKQTSLYSAPPTAPPYLEHGPGGSLAQHTGGAPHVVGGPPQERHVEAVVGGRVEFCSPGVT